MVVKGLFKKKDVYEYTRWRMEEGRVSDRSLIDNVLSKRIRGIIFDMNV